MRTERGNVASMVTPLEWEAVSQIPSTDTLLGPRPGVLAFDGNDLVVGEGGRLYLVDIASQAVRRIGRTGSGPGEFLDIDGASLVRDTLLVWDGGLRRMTWLLASTGVAFGTMAIAPPGRHGSPKTVALRPFAQGALLAWGADLVDPSGVQDSVIVALHSLTRAEETQRVAAIGDAPWADLGVIVAHRDAFGDRAVVAIGADGVHISGSGVEYCFDRRSAEGQWVVRSCRSWRRAPLALARELVSAESLGLPRRMDEMLGAIVRGQRYGDARNSYEELLLDDRGRAWVRVVDTSHIYHPAYQALVAALRPGHVLWDVFLPDGRLLASVRFPGHFKLQLVDRGRAVGFVELEDGGQRLAWGLVRLPEPSAP